MGILAINGGEKVRTKPFPKYSVIGAEETKAVADVMGSEILSKFVGENSDNFYGGPQVRALEAEWAAYFGVKHAISVNSATSALYCAAGAVGIGPGDEVIVSPYTMSASCVAPLVYNAIPVFADIERDYFCLDPVSVEENITERTKAIIVVDIFGQPYDADAINAIAKKHNLFVIEDAAQAPGASYKGKYAGTLGDIGVYSLNYHKHIHSGEGGIAVTNDDELAEKMRMIRNHAEAVIGGKGMNSLINMLGFNYRMTEVEAAICRMQLGKLGNLLEQRIKNVEYLTSKLEKIPALSPAKIRPGCKHSFYVHPIVYENDEIPRDVFVDAVKAELAVTTMREDEGVQIGCGYVKPLYLQPLFQQKIVYGDVGCPFSCAYYTGKPNYQKGICPVCEDMHYTKYFSHELMRPPMNKDDLDDVVSAFQKVWDNRAELANLNQK